MMAIRPFEWTEKYHRRGAYPTAFDLQMESETITLSDFLDHKEWEFMYDWWLIMAFAIDEIQDGRSIIV